MIIQVLMAVLFLVLCIVYMFFEDALKNEMVHLKGFIFSTFKINKYMKFIGKYIKHADLGCIWNAWC